MQVSYSVFNWAGQRGAREGSGQSAAQQWASRQQEGLVVAWQWSQLRHTPPNQNFWVSPLQLMVFPTQTGVVLSV